MEKDEREQVLSLIDSHRSILKEFIKDFSVLQNFARPRNLAKQLVCMLKKEKGLTYAEAYIALELAYIRLKKESNFIQLPEED
ncbi:hypothetical protein [Anaeroglobus geminatus]|nr:hypothetical protein [Anaeroglobus geminatus]